MSWTFSLQSMWRLKHPHSLHNLSGIIGCVCRNDAARTQTGPLSSWRWSSWRLSRKVWGPSLSGKNLKRPPSSPRWWDRATSFIYNTRQHRGADRMTTSHHIDNSKHTHTHTGPNAIGWDIYIIPKKSHNFHIICVLEHCIRSCMCGSVCLLDNMSIKA